MAWDSFVEGWSYMSRRVGRVGNLRRFQSGCRPRGNAKWPKLEYRQEFRALCREDSVVRVLGQDDLFSCCPVLFVSKFRSTSRGAEVASSLAVLICLLDYCLESFLFLALSFMCSSPIAVPYVSRYRDHLKSRPPFASQHKLSSVSVQKRCNEVQNDALYSC